MKGLLESILGSKTRTKLLTLFLLNPEQEFYVRELTRRLNERINSVRRELLNLTRLGLLVSRSRDKRRYYSINKNFIIFKELKALISRANTAPQKKLAKGLEDAGRIKYACLSGFFTQSPSRVDLLLVGETNRKRLEKFVKRLQKEQGREINYTAMSVNEFNYRKDLGDRFIKTILENEHVVLINKLK
jgi:DNA-binding transcriptional ArsR family regulator